MSLEVVSDLHQKRKLSSHFACSSFQLLCQCDIPHLRSSKIRAALAHAIDRKSICDNILQGGEVPAFSLSPRSLTFLDGFSFEDNNPDRARSLFNEGLHELLLTRETFPHLTLSYLSDPSIKPMIEAIQQQLQRTLGITIQLEPLDRGTYLRKVYTGDYEILNLSLNVWIHDPSSNLDLFKFRKTVINGTGWSDPEYTHQLDKASASLDPGIRRECFKKAEACIMTQLPVIPLCYQTFKYIKSPHLTGEAISPVGMMELKWLEQTG